MADSANPFVRKNAVRTRTFALGLPIAHAFSVCGACKVGKLVPLFTTRSSKAKAVNNAASKATGRCRCIQCLECCSTSPLDSPRVVASPLGERTTDRKTDGEDSDEELQNLVRSLGRVDLSL